MGGYPMANKDIRRHSISFVIRKMQIKTTMRYYHVLEWLTLLNVDDEKEQLDCQWNWQDPLWKTLGQNLFKLNMHLFLRPNNFTSWKIHNRSEAFWSPNDKSGHGSFIRVVTNWKQPECPWIVLLNGIAKWYSNQKELLPHIMWMNLTDFLLSKRSQMQKNT